MPGLFGEIRGVARPNERQAVPKLRESPGLPPADAGMTGKCCATCRHYATLPRDSMNRRCMIKVSWPNAAYDGCRDYAAKEQAGEEQP